jgi:hypothetical protein
VEAVGHGRVREPVPAFDADRPSRPKFLPR